MIRHHKQPASRQEPLWWLAPATLFCLVIGTTMLAAAWQSDAAYRLYGTPKFVGPKHLLLAGGAIIAFAIGSRLAWVTGKKPSATSERMEPLVAMGFWISVALTLFGYAAWLSVGIKNGFTLATFRELLATDDPHFAEELHRNIFNTIQGVTTCTQFGVAAMPMGLWLLFYRRRDTSGPNTTRRNVLGALVGLVALAVVRAIIFSERLAVVELLVPAAVVTLRLAFLGHKCSSTQRWLLQSAPLVGVASLLLFFGSFEYFRSWRYYRYEFDSYPQFVLWRVSGYYTTAHNNSAMALETRDAYPLPFATVQSAWTLAGMLSHSLRYQNLTGIDPEARHQSMLEQFGTAELNNEGGLFQPALDFGLAGMLAFWCVSGWAAGHLYRAFLAGNLTGVFLYPLVFLAILETPRFLYLCYSRALPPLLMLMLVSAVAVYGKKRATDWAALPAAV